MVKGAFKKIYHQHVFHPQGNGTLMTDVFDFEAPLGWIGRMAERMFLQLYMKKFLEMRNAVIKRAAEGAVWKQLLKEAA